MWVVKIGGSLVRDPRLPHWLQMLATIGGGRVTLVPGGGPFTEAARQAQAHWGFDDLAAHNMAVLGMAQFAQMLQALEPRLPLVQHDAEIREALHAGRPALWLPLTLLRHAPDELTSWDVTSDSIALWLARRLNAERLVIVKSCPIDATASLAELGGRGVLDTRFADWARDAAFPIEVLTSADIDRVRERLVGGATMDNPPWKAAPPPASSGRTASPRRRSPRPRPADSDTSASAEPETPGTLVLPRH